MPVLAIGDLRVPYLSPGLSQQFEDVLHSTEISSVFCVGNLCTWKVLKLLQSIADEVYTVKGKGDDHLFNDLTYDLRPPTVRTISYGKYRIGLASDLSLVPTADPLALSIIASSLSADVLIFGGSPTFQSFTYNNRVFIGPGSATGAFLPDISSEENLPLDPPLCRTVEVVDNPDLAANPGTAENITSYRFKHHPKLYVPTFVLLSFGTKDDTGKIEARIHMLLDGKLKVEILNYNIEIAT